MKDNSFCILPEPETLDQIGNIDLEQSITPQFNPLNFESEVYEDIGDQQNSNQDYQQISFSEGLIQSTIQPVHIPIESSIKSECTELKMLQEKRIEQLKKPVNQNNDQIIFQKAQFNVLVLGESGLGKTTFIQTLLSQVLQNIRLVFVFQNYNQKKQFQFRQQCKSSYSSLNITEDTVNISKLDLNLQISFIDAEGYNSERTIKQWFNEVKKIIITQYKIYQSKTKQLYKNKNQYQSQLNSFSDDRIHVCLYFLSGPRVSKDDLIVLKLLTKLVNIIPILAKGDSFTKEEQLLIKQQIRQDLQDSSIECYDCLKCLNVNNKNIQLKNVQVPFVVVSSNNCVGEKLVQGREYPWGICEVFDPEHSDLRILEKLLIGCYSLDLIQLTDYFFHNYIETRQIKKINRYELYLSQQKRIKSKQKQLKLQSNLPLKGIIKLFMTTFGRLLQS